MATDAAGGGVGDGFVARVAVLQVRRESLQAETAQLAGRLLEAHDRLAKLMAVGLSTHQRQNNHSAAGAATAASSSCGVGEAADDEVHQLFSPILKRVRLVRNSLVPLTRGYSREDLSDFDNSDDDLVGQGDRPIRLSVDLKTLASGPTTPTDDVFNDEQGPDESSRRSSTGRRRSYQVEVPSGVTPLNTSSAASTLSPPSIGPKKRWAKLRVTTMFLQAFHRTRYPWKQLAGHQANFARDENPMWILKKGTDMEEKALTEVMQDPVMRKCAVEYKGPTTKNGVRYLMLKNLLVGHVDPNIIDLKMGQRTVLVHDHSLDKPRMDLLGKLMKIDPSVPTAEEIDVGVTKRRYMLFREKRSTTASHGFRVESCHFSKNSGTRETFSKYNKDGHSHEQTLDSLAAVCRHRADIRNKVIFELEKMYNRLVSSTFFASHEIVGSSILVVVGQLGNVSTTMLDFGKAVPAKKALKHDIPISEIDDPNSQEDGYLVGLKNLIEMFRQCLKEEETDDEPSVQNHPRARTARYSLFTRPPTIVKVQTLRKAKSDESKLNGIM